MELGRLGVWYSTDRLDAPQLRALLRTVEGHGYSALWYPESRGFEFAVGLALPATLGLIVLSHPIVRLLFEHGLEVRDCVLELALAAAHPRA